MTVLLTWLRSAATGPRAKAVGGFIAGHWREILLIIALVVVSQLWRKERAALAAVERLHAAENLRQRKQIVALEEGKAQIAQDFSDLMARFSGLEDAHRKMLAASKTVKPAFTISGTTGPVPLQLKLDAPACGLRVGQKGEIRFAELGYDDQGASAVVLKAEAWALDPDQKLMEGLYRQALTRYTMSEEALPNPAPGDLGRGIGAGLYAATVKGEGIALGGSFSPPTFKLPLLPLEGEAVLSVGLTKEGTATGSVSVLGRGLH